MFVSDQKQPKIADFETFEGTMNMIWEHLPAEIFRGDFSTGTKVQIAIQVTTGFSIVTLN